MNDVTGSDVKEGMHSVKGTNSPKGAKLLKGLGLWLHQ
jgi:hypothetical protein